LAGRGLVGLDLLSQQLGASEVAPKLLGLEQIDPAAFPVGSRSRVLLPVCRGPYRKRVSVPGLGRMSFRWNIELQFIMIV
jgi:hypothetical protein